MPFYLMNVVFACVIPLAVHMLADFPTIFSLPLRLIYRMLATRMDLLKQDWATSECTQANSSLPIFVTLGSIFFNLFLHDGFAYAFLALA
uniref:HCO3_cotransp domain-containing protein n=1 Tax=Mesocestoides corti TaxID=53468 RepID=A0A5K3G237_MESCO